MKTSDRDSVPIDGSINVLHLSDLHIGMSDQGWMWPSFKQAFYQDLLGLHNRCGPWHAVIFSGDLTQKGSTAEFASLTGHLKDLWQHFKSMGSEPELFIVPGNHDLIRPAALDPVGKVLGQWWNDEEVQSAFWTTPDSPYRKTIEAAFDEFSKWCKELEVEAGIKIRNDVVGLLPGEASAVISKGGMRLGIVGLNSAWLQLSGADFKGKLCLHPNQLHKVTGGAPDEWCQSNHVNLIVTHHPTDWLHEKSHARWTSEIYSHKRFDAHLYGHMHEGNQESVSKAGGRARNSFQSASLFGLERYGSELQRAHGYSVLNIKISGSIRSIRIWPRKAVITKDGNHKLAADVEWTLIDDSYCDVQLDNYADAVAQEKVPQEILPAAPLPVTASVDALLSLSRSGFYTEAANSVRRTEQEYLVAALKGGRRAWLVSDWGLEGDEFLNCVQFQVCEGVRDIYYLDVHHYESMSELLSGVREQLGCNFEELCKRLDTLGKCVLVLDDFPSVSAGSTFEHDLLKAIEAVLDFCEEVRVVIRSRTHPSSTKIPTVELRPLDEPDTAAYILAHRHGGATLVSMAPKIYRRSGGIPARIDSLLRDLEIVGADSLHDLDADVTGAIAPSEESPPAALIGVIRELESSDEDGANRAFALLKVLAIFPQGELLNRVKRWYGAKPFWPIHARMLIERALVDAAAVPTLEDDSLLTRRGNSLMVRRPVREYLLQLISSAERRRLYARALSLYFGDEWELHGIRPPSDLKFDSSRCGAFEINNACTLILRFVHQSIELQENDKVRSALALTIAFGTQLRRGDHFRSLVNLLDDLVPIFDGYRATMDADLDVVALERLFCVALRMIGEVARSHELLTRIKDCPGSKSSRQSILLNLALCKDSLKHQAEEVVAVATACVELDQTSKSALQARSLIITLTAGDDAEKMLRELQKEARQKEAHIVANNIAIELASTNKNDQEKADLFAQVANAARVDGDHYNYVRSSLKSAKLTLSVSGELPQKQLQECALTYSYLYDQRIDSLFDECHSVLWQAFYSRGDQKNMLALFRHSSLIWRIRNRPNIEQRYIAILAGALGEKLAAGILTDDRDLRYFISRGASRVPREAMEDLA